MYTPRKREYDSMKTEKKWHRKRAVELGKTFMLGFSSRKFWNRKDKQNEYRTWHDALVVMTGRKI